MKKLSQPLLAKTVIDARKEKNYTQQQLSDLTGINRAMLSHGITGLHPIYPAA